MSAYYDSEGRLGIKTVSESPEIRNISERGDSEADHYSGSEADCIDGNSTINTSATMAASCMSILRILFFYSQLWIFVVGCPIKP